MDANPFADLIPAQSSNPFADLIPEKNQEGFTDRLQKVWEHPTKGSLFWLAKQAVEGVKGSIDSAKVANMTPQTEEEAAAVNDARNALPIYAAEAASVVSPGAPKGTGGVMAAPIPMRGPVGARPAMPSAQDLEAAYKAVRNSPEVKDATVPISDVEGLAAASQRDLIERGNRPTQGSAPRTFTEVNRLTPEAPPAPTPQQRLQAEMNWETLPERPRVTEASVDDLLAAKRAFGNIAQERKPFPQMGATEDAGAAGTVMSKLDDVIEQAAPGMKEANANYSAAQASKAIDNRIQKAELGADATNSGLNIGNKIRQQAVQVLTNPSARRGLKDDEVAMLKSLVQGTATRNTIRWFSNVFGGGGGLGAEVTGDIASRHLGPIGWALSPIGTALKHLENHLTVRAANQISDAIRARSPLGQAIESSAKKWDDARSAIALGQTSAKMAAFAIASRNLANTLSGAGAKIDPKELLRAIQGPRPVSAQDEQT